MRLYSEGYGQSVAIKIVQARFKRVPTPCRPLFLLPFNVLLVLQVPNRTMRKLATANPKGSTIGPKSVKVLENEQGDGRRFILRQALSCNVRQSLLSSSPTHLKIGSKSKRSIQSSLY
jgi:hypothetical protein